ncbi:hypothetical protein C3473_27280 [Mycobacterium kansasii]|uniref:hypothetical protein n=1 Tax=Mycobacterium kansasii TaxID=1768 RepID=UPI000CDDBB41|nr:hypothetical protein [Mycobacterium kansasii]POX88374.1 hypothetical protein C3473_27280 [Mycobacterium kansasii]
MTTGLPDFPVTTYDNTLPVHFDAPAVNPATPGLYAATVWDEVGAGEPSRFLNGVEVRGPNYGGADASGVWGSPWCGVPPIDGDDRKEGTRPAILDPFDPMTVWAYDECDLTQPSRAEVQARAAQVFRLTEQPTVERGFAARLLVDAADVPGGVATRPNIKEAVAYLEGAMAETNTVGFFHVAADLVAIEPDLFAKSGTARVSPSGHTWVIGGGYVAGLGDTIVATSQPFGWRDQVRVRTAIDERRNLFAAIAERNVLVGYEAIIAAVEIVP